MLYKAMVSFSGRFSMAKGDVREISDITIANDLISAGYIEAVETVKVEKPKKVEAVVEKEETEKPKKKSTSSKKKKTKAKES